MITFSGQITKSTESGEINLVARKCLASAESAFSNVLSSFSVCPPWTNATLIIPVSLMFTGIKASSASSESADAADLISLLWLLKFLTRLVVIKTTKNATPTMLIRGYR